MPGLGPPRWTQVGSKSHLQGWGSAFSYCLKLDVFASQKALGSILEGPGLDFGSSGPRIWRLQASIFEPPGQHAPEKLFFHKFPALSAFPSPFLPSPTACQSSSIPATRGGGGGGPPWGVQWNGAKLGYVALQKLSWCSRDPFWKLS